MTSLGDVKVSLLSSFINPHLSHTYPSPTTPLPSHPVLLTMYVCFNIDDIIDVIGLTMVQNLIHHNSVDI